MLPVFFLTIALPSSATKSVHHELTTRSSSSSSAGRKTASSNKVKNLKTEFDQMLYSTPSGRIHSNQRKKMKGFKNNVEYLEVINEHKMYETFDSTDNVEEKDRYTVSNDNYMNSQVNFTNCGLVTIVDLCIVVLHLLNYILLQ